MYTRHVWWTQFSTVELWVSLDCTVETAWFGCVVRPLGKGKVAAWLLAWLSEHLARFDTPLISTRRGSLLKFAAPPLDLSKGLTQDVHPPPFTWLLSASRRCIRAYFDVPMLSSMHIRHGQDVCDSGHKNKVKNEAGYKL